MPHRSRPPGFTLIEMMIVLVIIGILAGIAGISYSKYKTRVVRVRAMDCLTYGQGQMEGYFVRHNVYANTLAQIGVGATCGDQSEYQIAIVAAATSCPVGHCYELTATPVGTQAKDGVLHLKYDFAGATPALRLVRTRVTSTGTLAW